MTNTEKRSYALSLFKQRFNAVQIATYTGAEITAVEEWQKEHEYIESRLTLLHSVLMYCTSKGGIVFNTSERILINQERARLIRDNPITEPYPYSKQLANKIDFTLLKINELNKKS